MHLQMASALADERQRELARRVSQRQAVRVARQSLRHDPRRPAGARTWRIPHYRVSWSRTTLPGVGAGGRRGRSWVIVISATR
jgi:hypothetical protein